MLPSLLLKLLYSNNNTYNNLKKTVQTVLDRKFNEKSKNVFKTVIFLLQVGFTADFVPDCSVNSNFDTVFFPECTKFCIYRFLTDYFTVLKYFHLATLHQNLLSKVTEFKNIPKNHTGLVQKGEVKPKKTEDLYYTNNTDRLLSEIFMDVTQNRACYHRLRH